MKKRFILPYATNDNTNDALVPEKWSLEALALLYENSVALHLVHRDYDSEIAESGDVVNIHRPSKFTIGRIIDTESVTTQDADTENIQVPLDQGLYVSFTIGSAEQSKSFKDLLTLHLAPAIRALSSGVDNILLGQVMQFLPYNAGRLGNMSASTIHADIVSLRKVMQDNLVPLDGRNLIFTTNAEAFALNLDTFIEAHKVGDDGTALREASIGRKFGFNIFTCQNMTSLAASDVTTTAGSLDTAEALGQTVLSCTAAGDETINHWLTVAGDDIPHMLIATSTGDTNTVWPALKRAAIDTAVITHYTQCAVNQDLTTKAAGGTASVDGYRAGWHGAIEFDGSGTLVVGQMCTFGVTADDATKAAALARYTVIAKPSATSVLLDRPLELAIATNGIINPGPAGDYNFAFRRDAVAFVTRPFEAPDASTGARSFVASSEDLSLRVTITWEGRDRGYLVVVDMLSGVAVLDSVQGAVLYG